MEGQNTANVIFGMPLSSDYQVIMSFQKAKKLLLIRKLKIEQIVMKAKKKLKCVLWSCQDC